MAGRRLRAIPDPVPTIDVTAAAPDVRAAVREHVAALTLEAVDEPLVVLALLYADQIETARRLVADLKYAAVEAEQAGEHDLQDKVVRLVAEIDTFKLIATIGPLLHRALHDLGGAAVARAKLPKDRGDRKAGRLAVLRGEVQRGA